VDKSSVRFCDVIAKPLWAEMLTASQLNIR